MAEEYISPEMTSAARVVVLANSPNYVLTRLRLDPTVQSFSMRFSVDELTAWLESNLKVDPETIDDLARRYVYLVALSLKEPSEFAAALDSLDLTKLEWGEELRVMMKASAMSNIQTTFRAPIKSSVLIAETIAVPTGPIVKKIEIVGV